MTQEKPVKRGARKGRVKVQRERGPALSLWIVVLGLFAAYALIVALAQSSAISVVSAAFLAACVIGLWYWQRWAYFGVLAAFSLVIVVSAVAGAGANIGTIALALLLLVITVALVQPKLAAFR